MVITNKVFKSWAQLMNGENRIVLFFTKFIGLGTSFPGATTKLACGTKRILYWNANYLRTNVSRLSTCGSGFCFTHKATINFNYYF